MQAVEAGSTTSGRAWLVACLALTVGKLWLVGAQWLHAIWPAPADDGLFVKLAENILAGIWLGPLGAYTLSKGPVYPAWVALVHLTGLRLLVAQAMLYALAAAVLVVALRPVMRAPWRSAALYALVLLNPASWAAGPATRVSRDAFYASLTLLLLALLAGAALRAGRSPRMATAWAAVAGLVGSLLFMTREEGVWLVPSVAVLAGLGLFQTRRAGWRAMLGAVAAAVVAYVFPIVVVAGLNWRNYGLAETCEMRAPYFTRAYGALTRVRTPRWNPVVPVSREARARLHEVSAAYRDVGPTIERDAANWTVHGCRTMGECEDISGGWFVWAFREATQAAGKYASGPDARAWYERLANEVDAACRSGRLDCTAPRSTLAPPWRSEYLVPLLREFARALAFLGQFDLVRARPLAPQGAPRFLKSIQEVTNEQLPAVSVTMEGLIETAEGQVEAAVLDAQGTLSEARLRDVSSPGSQPSGPGGAPTRRLALETACGADCFLILFTPKRSTVIVPIAEEARATEDGITWRTERFSRDVVADESTQGRAWRFAVLDALTVAYRWLVPVLGALAIVVTARRIARCVRARTISPGPAIAVSFLLAVLVRAALVAFITVTSFPAVSVTYLAPAYALLLAFVGVALLGTPRSRVGAGGDQVASFSSFLHVE